MTMQNKNLSAGVKTRFESIVRNIFTELNQAQEKLVETISNLNITGTFGESHIREVKRLESVVLALPIADVSYFESDDYKNSSDEVVYKWVEEIHQSLTRRKRDLFVSGLSVKKHWEASGVMQAKIELERALRIN